MILGVGGRSKIGAALVGDLLARDETVRALARSVEGTAGFPARVEVVSGDLGDVTSLRRAMERFARTSCHPAPEPLCRERARQQHALDRS